MPRSLIGTARDAARGVLSRRKSYLSPDEPAHLGELVSPLRYDILIRAQYFKYLSERLDLFDNDFDEYAERAKELPYFAWFRSIALARYRPDEAGDQDRLIAAFHDRLRRSTALYRSFQTNGFDVRYPISLRRARAGAATSTGKLVPRRLYAGDGCHRLALLVMSGRRDVPTAYFRVRADPLDTIIDNTVPILRLLDIQPGDYAEFLSLGYADAEAISDLDALVSYVAEHTPHRLPELRHVIAVDSTAVAGGLSREH